MANDLLAGYPATVDIPVAWGEMDALGHVNNIVYFRYFETARIHYLVQAGFIVQNRADGIGPILASVCCRFRRPLTFPDTVTVGVRVTGIATDRLTIHHRLVSQKLGVVAAEGEGVIVSYNYRAGGKAPLPPDVVEAIRRLEGPALADNESEQ